MATTHSIIDWSRCTALESKPDTQGGAWVFRGTRVPVTAVLRNLTELSLDQIAAEFPTVKREHMIELIEFMAESVDSKS